MGHSSRQLEAVVRTGQKVFLCALGWGHLGGTLNLMQVQVGGHSLGKKLELLWTRILVIAGAAGQLECPEAALPALSKSREKCQQWHSACTFTPRKISIRSLIISQTDGFP